ncbi:MAG: hypothetical protein AAF738_10560, partial [Bacteroidota bacterium]
MTKEFLSLFAIFISIMCAVNAQSTGRFISEINRDSVLLGNTIQVKFILEDAEAAQFYPPTLEDVEVVSGPNTSVSMIVTNGAMQRSTT